MPMSFITAKSFVFNGINSSDYNVVIGWVDSDITVSENGLNRELRKTTNQTRTTANIYGAENIDVISFEFDIVRIDGKEITRTQSIMKEVIKYLKKLYQNVAMTCPNRKEVSI
jgi:hypothetical protein